jgi:amino acid adenylation domain-containing protein
VGRLDVLPPDERRQLLVANNDTARRYRTGLVHQLFEAQAAERPDATALITPAGSLTYQELNTRANRLAHRLLACRLSADTPVGVCLDRGADLVAALLAILKAGAAYLPLDPGYPARRLQRILDDASPPVLITASGQRLPAAAAQVINLDAAGLSGQPAHNPARAISPRHLAYLIYTSGSTGLPKGVEVPPGAHSNLLRSMSGETGIRPGDKLLAVTSTSFDIAALEIFMPLIVGAAVDLFVSTASDALALRADLERSHPAFLQATPATWRLLIEAGWPGDPNVNVICGGEALPATLARDLATRCRSLQNAYGPTETTVWSSLHPVQSASPTGAEVVPIGRPIANTRIYILDRWHRPVPTGTPGDLYIGGAGLARGYHANPVLTARRFIPDPYGPPGSRMYRTGDLARWLPDHSIEFLGRRDHQIKLRGHRIEPAEIEAALSQHPSVTAAAVTLRTDQPSQAPYLAAYLTTRPPAPDPAQLRGHLAQHLPDYMLPTTYTLLEHLPLTPNGKLDRAALPAPDHERTRAAAAYSPPASPLEERLARLWSDILALDHIGIHDNFFDLGGDSILALRLIMRIRETEGEHLLAAALLAGGTIAHMAAAIRQSRRDRTPSLVALRDSGSKPPFFCVRASAGRRRFLLRRTVPRARRGPALLRATIPGHHRSLRSPARIHRGLRSPVSGGGPHRATKRSLLPGRLVHGRPDSSGDGAHAVL